MAATESPSGGVKRSRSPSYPGISLDVAIQRAKKLYDIEKRHAAPVATIAAHWGYKFGTSSSNTSIAALKKFGLLADEGARDRRMARLTDLALEILLNPQPTGSIRMAALLPRIHKELYDKYGASLPSDASLKHELIMTRNFTESGADDFISQYKKTLAFAGLDEEPTAPAESVAPLRHDEAAVQERSPSPTPSASTVTPTAVDGTTIPIPLVGGMSVAITAQFPISEAAWQQFIRVLDAMKPGLVVESEDS
ncbi:hypothetical protein SMC26_24140 [Actinomadura fulvescens]|uniref:Uncharacterized protein n=1 Tax=Actinomadura fulvescens TaxID=46160 RepID=A0ABP6CIL8_9ACTN